MLATEGVYLSGATYWYPRFDDELVTFALDAQLRGVEKRGATKVLQ